MLPECRQDEYLYSVPFLDLTPSDTKTFMEELRGLHKEFSSCFIRSETRERVFQYSIGQLSALERKSIEPMAVQVENSEVRPLQRAISEAFWEEGLFLNTLHRLVEEDMGEANGAIVFDESGFVKKGKDSSGVSRQYCGNVGKVENCQVGVYASYVSSNGYTFLDKRLFIPECWFSEEYEQRWKKCRIPDELEFSTKPQLAIDMLKAIQDEGVLSYKYVLGDSIYGQSPTFINAVEDIPGKVYFVSVNSETQFWLKAPSTKIKDYTRKGQTHSKKVLKNKADSPMTVSGFAKSLNDFFWYRRKVSEGTKGPIEYEFTKRRVTLAKDGLPDKTVWLFVKRTIGDKPVYSFYFSNAPLSTKMATFVWLSGLRWSIEQCFEEAKSELGMDQYEVRKYAGWNHHMLLSMLAHYFLWHLKIRLEKKSSLAYLAPA